ncbi:MAG: 50S ribosomal protein L31 [Candidatus Yanofskybacteria bacterium]|nr:50S ribosomal protein L31 [Candidatus Yanofskybacteria bacterium]
MKKDIHPTYYPEAKISCVCGNVFTMGAAKETMNVEVCSACHPFYTGQEKIIESVGQVQKFRERASRKSTAPRGKTAKKQALRQAPKAKKSKSS